jgi:hypothetical protein
MPQPCFDFLSHHLNIYMAASSIFSFSQVSVIQAKWTLCIFKVVYRSSIFGNNGLTLGKDRDSCWGGLNEDRGPESYQGT